MAKIMIVDDSETVRLELKDVLGAYGHEVIVCVDGDDGLAAAERHEYIDLVITDYNMPGLDGLAMVSKMKALPQYAATPFAMLTTESSRDLKEAGKTVGITVWIVKPFDRERLMTTVGKLFEKFPPRP